MFPEGRIGTRRFLEITGLSKTTFYTRYRKVPRWIDEFDIRMDESDRLSFDEDAARQFAAGRVGRRAHGITDRARRLNRHCPQCEEQVPPRARFCPSCGASLAS